MYPVATPPLSLAGLRRQDRCVATALAGWQIDAGVPVSAISLILDSRARAVAPPRSTATPLATPCYACAVARQRKFQLPFVSAPQPRGFQTAELPVAPLKQLEVPGSQAVCL